MNYRRAPLPVIAALTTLLEAFMENGVPLTCRIACGLAEGVFRSMHVEWVPSLEWMRRFLARSNLSYRRATTAARKLPRNFDEVQDRFLQRCSSLTPFFSQVHRVTWIVRKYHIVPSLIVNLDETGTERGCSSVCPSDLNLRSFHLSDGEVDLGASRRPVCCAAWTS